jgi:hypothetical protein
MAASISVIPALCCQRCDWGEPQTNREITTMTRDHAEPASYVRSIEGKTETMIPIGPHEAVNETSAKALGLLAKRKAQ